MSRHTSVYIQKRRLSRGRSYVPKYYSSGKRKLQILHTRIRTNCSSLNYDLFQRNINDSTMPMWGHIKRRALFFLCSIYQNQGTDVINSDSVHSKVFLQIILNGNNTLSYRANIAIFETVHKNINDTKIFWSTVVTIVLMLF